MRDVGQLSGELAAHLPGWMREQQVPGTSVALISDGVPAWAEGFGVTNVATGQPVTSQTVFEAASLSKPVFAHAVLHLAASGLLDLDAPLSAYLPGPPLTDDARLEQVTARRVLSHTTGFPNWRPGRFSDSPEPLTINFAPGERFGYSGEGYEYLQRVVEHLTGRPLAAYMDREVLRPLGMSESSYTWREEYHETAAQRHFIRDGVLEPAGFAELSEVNAAFSLLTTPTDFARFVQACLASPPGDMLTPQVEITDDLAWGLGWGLWRRGDSISLWHWGNNGTAHCFVTASATGGRGIVVMTNGDRGQAVCRAAVTLALGEPHPAFAWLDR